MFRVCHVFLSFHRNLVVTCWERADLLALLYVMFYCVFVTLSCCVPGQVLCLIISISDLCLLSYFEAMCLHNLINFGLIPFCSSLEMKLWES